MMEERRVVTLFLCALTCFLCTFEDVQGYSTTKQEVLKDTCDLVPTMKNVYCFPPDRDLDTDDEYTVYAEPDGTSTPGSDDRGRVADGTLCVLVSGHPRAVTCRSGVWVTSKIPQGTHGRLTTATGHKLLVRKKRFWGWVAVAAAVVTWLVYDHVSDSWKKGGPDNNRPSIVCPTIPEQFTDERNFQQLVKWDHATASDPEEGTLTPELTQSPGAHTGVWLQERKDPYTVSYRATDSRCESVTCSVSFHVTARRCDDSMATLSNGQVSCTHEYIWGSTCTFTCDQNYELIGNYTSVTCPRDLRWSGEKPVCREFSCPAVPQVDYGEWVGCNRKVQGADCTLVCQDGFREEGNKTISCLSKTEWSEPGSCVDIQAPNFTCPADIVTYSARRKEPIAVYWDIPVATDNSDEVIVVTSNRTSGHLFPVGRHDVRFEAQDSTGNARTCDITVVVQVKRCQVLETPDHASVTCSHERAVGSTCSFTCAAGFHIQGVVDRECLDTQEWSHSQPTCQRNDCGALQPVQSGSFACPNGTVFESICTLACDSGYNVVGTPTTVCDSASQWTTVGHCRDDTPPEFISGCPSKQVEAPRLGVAPILTYDLPQVTDNSNGPVTVTGDPPTGSEVSDVGTVNVTAVATDETGNSVSCIFPVHITRGECLSPYNSGIDTSEGQLMDFDCPDGFVHGAPCSLSCSDGNPVQGGGTSITCERKTGDALEFEWFTGNVQPTCEDNQCDIIAAPQYGATSCSEIADRTICALFCQAGYAYPKIEGQTADSFYCDTGVGQWVPAVIDTNVCLRGRPPRGQTMMPDIYYYDSDCSVSLDQIKENFLQVVNDSSILQGKCGTVNVTCEVTDVTVTCGARRRRDVGEHEIYKRQTSVIKAVFQITLTPHDPDSLSQGQLLDLVTDINNAYFDNTDAGKYDIGVGTTDHTSYGSGVLVQECDGARQVRVPDRDNPAVCVPCGKGYIFTGSGSPCSACPLGTYQPEEEARICTPCPGNSTTKYTASEDLNNCLDLCPTGSSSRDGREPCDLCPVGTYQSNRGQTSCDECPFGRTTEERGATSNLQCQIYEWTMTEDSSTWPELNVSKWWTLLTFVKYQPGPTNMLMTFTLNHDPTAAHFGLGNMSISIKESPNTTKKKREFHHVALVHNNGNTTLYLDGQLESATQGLPDTDLHTSGETTRLEFYPTTSFTELRLHGLQIIEEILTQEEIVTYTQSCHKTVESNLLLTDKPLKSFTTLSDCDVIDDCADTPCGAHGTCIDLRGSFKCECDTFWSGDRCQTPVDLCENHQCDNGASCENVYEDNTYKCLCVDGFRGTFCREPIVHGGWGAWPEWSLCNQSCNGTQSRERACDTPVPGPEGRPCVGPSIETMQCNTACPEDCEHTEWSSWQCPMTCCDPNGLNNRGRVSCDPIVTRRRSFEPAKNGGLECIGPLVQYQECTLDHCPVPGNYTEFSPWSECSKSCGVGQSTRVRSCTNPEPMYGGENCDRLGPVEESRTCNEHDCPTCPNLRRNSNQELKEELNETTQVKTVRIVCKQGFTAALTSLFCGPITNWTWSHVTKDNPTGLLPRCTNSKVPERRGMSIAGDMDDVEDDGNVADAIKSKAQLLTGCTEPCSVSVQSTRKSSSRKKRSSRNERSTAAFTFNVTLSMDSPTAGADLATATDSEYAAQMAALEFFRDAGTAFLNNLADIYSVVVNGVQYAVDMETLTGILDFACPVGYEPFNGLCVACSPGTYWSNSLCWVCPRDQYQEQSAQMECNECPEGTSTVGLGSQSKEDCLGQPTHKDGGGGSKDTLLIIGIVFGCLAAIVVLVGVIFIVCLKCGGDRTPRCFQRGPKSSTPSEPPPPYRPGTPKRGATVDPWTRDEESPFGSFHASTHPPAYSTGLDLDGGSGGNTRPNSSIGAGAAGLPLSVMHPQPRPFSGTSASGVAIQEKGPGHPFATN